VVAPHPKALEHQDHVVGPVPGFAGHPAIGRKEPDRVALPVDRERHQMADLVAAAALQGRGLARRRSVRNRELRQQQRGDPGGHPPAAQEEVEMAVLDSRPWLLPRLLRGARPGRAGVAMVEILGVTGRIVNLALGIMPPLDDVAGAIGCTPAPRITDNRRLANYRGAARGKRLAAFAQRRGRRSLALRPIHGPLPPSHVNDPTA